MELWEMQTGMRKDQFTLRTLLIVVAIAAFYFASYMLKQRKQTAAVREAATKAYLDERAFIAAHQPVFTPEALAQTQQVMDDNWKKNYPSWPIPVYAANVATALAAAGQLTGGGEPAPNNKGAEELRDGRYPARWWKAVSKTGAPEWEVLPQEAGAGEVILSKRQPDLGLLSNFALTPFEFHGKKYASLEGFWQMMKYPEGADDVRTKFPGLQWKHTRDEVAGMTAFDAKHAGDLASDNMKKMGIDWITFEGRQMPYKPAEPGDHYKLIVEATWAKVKQNPDVKAALLSTGDLILKPDHHQEADAAAAWKYYDILMNIRSQLQKDAPAAK
jgi:predicted NAD-dependent protein-ADP-ribosyltransferase YbiA (DUF1768 family)